MGFKSEQIHASSTETEKEWVQRIINLIVSMDSRITCDTDADEQYADSTSSGRATFDIDIGGHYILRLKRRNTNNNTTSGYIFSIVVDDVEYYISSSTLRFWYSSTTANSTVANGYFKVSTFIADDFIFMWFGVHHDTSIAAVFPSAYSTSFITDEDDETYANGYDNSNNITSKSYYKCSDGGSGYTLSKCLNYIDQVGTISYLANMYVPIYSNGNPSKFAQGLIASSTRTLGDYLIFDGKNYFAVGTNILAEIAAS